jgi:hypothetical protein
MTKQIYLLAGVILVLLVLVSVLILATGLVVGNADSVIAVRRAEPFFAVRAKNMVWHIIGNCKLVDVYVSYGTQAKVEVIGDSNITQYIGTAVDDGELAIYLTRFIRPKGPIKINATTPGIGNAGDTGPRHLGGMACQMDWKYEFGRR